MHNHTGETTSLSLHIYSFLFSYFTFPKQRHSTVVRMAISQQLKSCITQWVNKERSGNLKFSWASHCGAFSGEVFRAQSDVFNIHHHFSGKTIWWNEIHFQTGLVTAFTEFHTLLCERWRKWMVARRSMDSSSRGRWDDNITGRTHL